MRVLVLFFFLLLGNTLIYGEPLDQIFQKIQDRQYREAIQLIEKVPEYQKNPQLLYLLGNTSYLAGDYKSARHYLETLLKNHPESEWRFKAVYKEADIALKEQKFEEAYLIYKTQVKRLTEDKRKAELAGIYLKYADQFFNPADPDTKPDYNKALNLYKEAKELVLAVSLEQEVTLKQALCYYYLKNYVQSASLLETLKASLLKEKNENATLAEHTLYYLADSYYLQNQRSKARQLFRDFLAQFPKSDLIPKVLYQISLTYNFPSPANTEDLESGIRILKQLLEQYPTHELAPQSAYNLALACYNLGQYDRAIQEFQKVKDIPGASAETQSEYRALAELMVGYCYYYQKKYDDAKNAWQNYLRLYPNHQKWTEIQKEIINLEYLKGEEFYHQKDWEKVRNQWKDFLLQYPLDPRAADIMFRIGETYSQEKNWEAAIREWTKLIQKFPQSNPASQAQFEIGRIYELEFAQFEKAMETYRTLTWGSYYSAAQERLRQMKEKQLEVLSERVFLSQEVPSLKVTTRNLETLKVRVYEVDLLAYFQKMKTIKGVEKLDLALIEPDETFDFAIEKFEKFRVTERQLPLPKKFHRPGVYAVNISTDTMEAFSIVVVSDIALILKATRQDLLVFAENMAQKQPAEGVSIYVADSKGVVFEGQTDANGFFYQSGEKLKDLRDLRVFGANAQGNASNELNLNNLSYATGLTARGFLYTDRPAYRPGETAYLRGILREVKESVYHFEKDSKYTLQVLTPEGKQILTEELVMNPFGTVHAECAIPAGASLGTYRIRVFQKEGSSFTGSFEVQEYQIERYKLSILPEKPYYYRGETIEGTLKVEYYYGEPVVGQMVSYGITNQGTEKQKTNEKGEVPFRFETTDYNEKQLLTLWANLDGENVSAQHQLWITTKGFEIALSTLRGVFLTKESFDVQVKTNDISGKPVSASLQYEVAELVTTNGNVAEKRVQEGLLQTNVQGEGKFALNLEKGGSYRIRVRGEDRFKNGISGQHQVFISGDEDEEKLRILTDTDRFSVGDKSQVQVIWRGEESLALVTYEGDKIYQSYLTRLQKGQNKLQVEMTNQLSPNFAMGIAVMEKNIFSHVQKEFEVSRQLQISVKTDKKEYTPGEEVEVLLDTTDNQGQGISAELSLAVVDEALLNLFPDKLPAITTFFYGQKRSIHVGTSATNTFSFAGATTAISEEVLKELEKAKDAMEKPAMAKRESRKAKLDRASNEFGAFGDDSDEEMEEFDAGEGSGGGQFGGRFGGKKSLVKRGAGGIAKNGEAQGEVGAFDSLEQLRTQFLSTAYWNANIVTDKAGKSKVKVKLPDNTTSWRLVVYGVNAEILVGRGQHSIQVKKDFFVELKTPKMLAGGDTPHPLVTVHNYSEKTLTAQVSLETVYGQTKKKQTVELTLKPKSQTEQSFPLEAVQEGELTLIASAKTAELSDSVRKTVQVQSLATLVQRGTGGMATQDFSTIVELPKTTQNYRQTQVQIRYGPSLSSVLLDGELSSLSDGTTIASNGLVAYFTLRYLESVGISTGAIYRKWFNEFESATLHLLLNQNNDGGFSYGGLNAQTASQRFHSATKPSLPSDPNVSAGAMRLLTFAKSRGIEGLDNAITSGTRYLKNMFSQASSNSEKSTLLYGLVGTKDIDFAYVNRLYRERNTLDSYSLALLSLIFSGIDRREYAKEVAELLQKRNIYQESAPKVGRDNRREVCWVSDPTELVAFAANAFIQAGLSKSQIETPIQYLLKWREGRNWSSPKANAAATEAISSYLAEYKPSKEDKYRIAIRVNNNLVHQAEVTGAQPMQEVTVALDTTTQAKIDFQMEGNVQIAYQAKIEGWLRGIQKLDEHRIFKVKHSYTPSPLRFKGQEIPRGFNLFSGSYKTWENEVRNLPEGDFTEVVLSYYPQRYDETYDSYLVLEEFIPGGTTILEPSIQGDFQNYEIRDGKIRFYLNQQSGTLKYRLYGYLPGGYQILPSRLWNLFQPYRMSTGESQKFSILKRGEVSQDPFKHTPMELYHLGKLHFEEGNYSEAEKYLEELFKYENLQESYYRETARMLLYTAIERNSSKDIVKYFEILKERYPSLFIDFGRIIRIGSAYGDIKEFERGLQVFRATIEANFLKEANVSGTLNEQGELVSSIEFMLKLLQNYPDIPAIQTARYSLSQFVYESAEKIKNNLEWQQKHLTWKQLLQQSAQHIREFLIYYPENPIADEASFSLANIHLDLKEFEQVIVWCEKLMQRYSRSLYMDDFLYIQGLAHFNLRQYEQALQTLKRLAEERFPAANHTTALSDNRFLAQYIMGQIYHSRGDVKQAIEHYSKIKTRFEDAKDTIEYFEEKQLSLAEISSFKVGESVAIELTHRNIKDVDIKVYKVDLMTLYVLKKNLNQITNIHLAGIKPSHTRVEKFSDEYREVKTKLTLPLEKEGAYLVVAKGDQLDCSGMVLITDLKLIVQEDSESGTVRVNVLNQKNNTFVDQAHVKVIGSQSGTFQSGNTDLRGIFVANNVQGAATVIAKKENLYAFYRGEIRLQEQTRRPIRQQKVEKLNKLIEDTNLQNRSRQSQQYKQLFESMEDGVEIESTK